VFPALGDPGEEALQELREFRQVDEPPRLAR
jgi:hypothetical protein